MAWESVPGCRKDVATGCNAEREQVNRHPEHQQERLEGQKVKPKSRREQFSLPPSQDPSPGQSMSKGGRGRGQQASRRGRALGAGLPGVHTSLHADSRED